MLLHEKISVLRKMNNLSQEAFAEALGVSRQAVSKWENGTSIPDVQMLLKIADAYNLTVDQLVRDEMDLPVAKPCDEKQDSEANAAAFAVADYLGKVCDVSMHSFLFSVLRNAKIVGQYKNLVCFEKNGKYGYFNPAKLLSIVEKRTESYTAQNDLICGKCTVFVNKGYLGGHSYLFSRIVSCDGNALKIRTGKFVATERLKNVSVILLSDKTESIEKA